MFRTLAFRFAGTYALIFTLFVSLILGIVYIVATQEIRGISEREIQYDMQALRSAYSTGGISQLSFAISEHAEGAPGDDFYLLAENGRMIAGRPTNSRPSMASSMVWAALDLGLSSPSLSMASRNFWRSSALSMTSALAPIISTP